MIRKSWKYKVEKQEETEQTPHKGNQMRSKHEPFSLPHVCVSVPNPSSRKLPIYGLSL